MNIMSSNSSNKWDIPAVFYTNGKNYIYSPYTDVDIDIDGDLNAHKASMKTPYLTESRSNHTVRMAKWFYIFNVH